MKELKLINAIPLKPPKKPTGGGRFGNPPKPTARDYIPSPEGRRRQKRSAKRRARARRDERLAIPDSNFPRHA